MRPVRALVTSALAAAIGLPMLMIGGLSATATATPLTIALLNDVTGPGGSGNAGTNAVFNAAIDAQNAAGGVNGHKLVGTIIDTQTSPASAATGVQEAIANGAIGIVSNTFLMDLVAKYPNQTGVPVTGFYADGKEWGEKPYNQNMFAGDDGSVDPTEPISTLYGKLAKLDGAKRVALYTLNVNSQGNNLQTYSLAKADPSTKVVVQNNSVPYGGSNNFGPDALVAKQAGVDWMWSNLDSTSNVALVTAYKQAGVPTKHIYLPDGYSDTLPKSPAWQDVQGATFMAIFRPFSIPNAGTERMQAALMKYAGWTKSNYPDLAQSEVWANTELMITGLETAGSNPTHASVDKAIRNIKAWNDDGMLPYTIDFQTIFGHEPPSNCVWLEQAEKSGFVLLDKQPVCGPYIAGTHTESAPSS